MKTADEMKHRFLDFRRRLYAEHDLTAVDAYIHPDFSSHNPLVSGPGRAAYKAFVQMLHQGVPDLTPVAQHLIVEGSWLMAMTDWVGTHRGTFLGAPASGAVLSFKTADRYELRDGMLFEHWDVVDRLDAMVGLGLLHQGPADSGRD